MLSDTRALVIGLISGLLLAVLFQQLLVQAIDSGPAHLSTSISVAMAAVLKNPLQIAAQVLRRGGYKSIRIAPVGSSKHQTNLFPASTGTLQSFSITSKPFVTSSYNMASSKSFLEAVKERRTYYSLNKEVPLSDKQIVDIVNTLATHVPSSFNCQSTRQLVLLNEEHDKFWDLALEALKPMLSEEQLPTTSKKLAGFKAAYGTILLFEDQTVVEGLKRNIPIYAHHFGDWSEHTNAMHAFALWTALEAEGLGANLQHYNPVVDDKVRDQWKLPAEWKLRAQLVFGGRAGQPGEKTFEPLEKKVQVRGAKM